MEGNARSLAIVSIPQAAMTTSSRGAIAFGAPWRALSEYHPEEFVSAFKSIKTKESAEVSDDG